MKYAKTLRASGFALAVHALIYFSVARSCQACQVVSDETMPTCSAFSTRLRLNKSPRQCRVTFKSVNSRTGRVRPGLRAAPPQHTSGFVRLAVQAQSTVVFESVNSSTKLPINA